MLENVFEIRDHSHGVGVINCIHVRSDDTAAFSDKALVVDGFVL